MDCLLRDKTGGIWQRLRQQHQEDLCLPI